MPKKEKRRRCVPMQSNGNRVRIAILEGPRAEQYGETLARHGYAVRIFAPGSDYLRSLADFEPAIILLEALKRNPGQKIIQALRRHAGLRNIHILTIMTPTLAAANRESFRIDVASPPRSGSELCERVDSAVRGSRWLEKAPENSLTLTTLTDIYGEMNSTLEAAEILHVAAKKLGEMMDLVRCSFISVEREQGIGRVLACKDDPNIHDLQIRLRNYPEILMAMNKGEHVIITDVGHDPIMSEVLDLTEKLRDQSIMTLPLKLQGTTVGVLQIRKKGKPKGFSPSEITFCRLIANSAAIALKNAQLFRELELRNRELSRGKADLESLSAELREKNEKLLELQKLKEDFSAMVVHDTKNPLAIISGIFEVLKKRFREDSLEREIIDDGLEEAQKMLSLVNNLLDIARIESGEIELNLELVDAEALIRDSLEHFRILAAERQIQLRHRIARSLPPLVADRGKIIQVLANLLSNALDYAPRAGTVEVRADLLPGPASGGAPAIRISVSDSGPGIPEADIPHIFEKFRRGRSEGSRRGTGLGLTIVDYLVRAHKGKIEVTSKLGKGSKFMFTLPAAGVQ
jgi:signal transduction histidine kinase/DNA-binding response OmpR family regulator